MTEKRNWRDAKLPQWVRDAIEAEQAADRIRAALSWPTEARPTPLPFRWVDYDRLIGTAVPGCYFHFGAQPVHIRAHDGQGGKKWQFSSDGECWTTSVTRGPLFTTKREAVLNRLWEACEKAARELDAIRNGL